MFSSLIRDPRHYQMAVLSLLLGIGLTQLALPISPFRIVVAVGTALLTQVICTRVWRLPRLDLRSPFISSLSLCLLLRSDSALWIAAAAVIAVASKFLIRRGSKHIFNPTAFAIAVLMGATSHVWVSPGQWGSVALLGFFLAGLGGLVVYRAARSDVTWAFLGAYASILFARAAWLGDPFVIPLHQLQSGGFLLFAFFMISDPRTTPDSRVGRIVYAVLVAGGSAFVHFGLFENNGFIWSLCFFAPMVPILDRIFPGHRYEWSRPRPQSQEQETPIMAAFPSQTCPSPSTGRPIGAHLRQAAQGVLTTLAVLFLMTPDANAFCGFYVGKAGAQLYNKTSQVVLVRKDDRTVITMASDFKGDLDEFALVVPVPTFIERGQIHIADQSLVDHIDAFTAPRLVEYFDPDPCAVRYRRDLGMLQESADAAPMAKSGRAEGERYKGVAIEATYTVGEYDILILSATQSNGLENWLVDNGYTIPDGANDVLESYIKQKMRFFVAKVNLGAQAELGYNSLRPIQVAYESPKFMLPLRLGTVNADGPQDLLVYTLTERGRVEPTNYRTIRIPTGTEIPEYVQDDFGAFYASMFDRQVERHGMRGVFVEYAWNMAWCDPCAADPLSRDQLRELGVFWAGESGGRGGASPVFVTRLHVRYDQEHFPEDLVLQETGDNSNFQGRYVIRHPWKGSSDCQERWDYENALYERKSREAKNLADLTGWQLSDIQRDMDLASYEPGQSPRDPWWKSIWSND